MGNSYMFSRKIMRGNETGATGLKHWQAKLHARVIIDETIGRRRTIERELGD
jgi:hypothetical protein